MGLDISTLFVANIFVLAISSLAYVSVYARSRMDRYWLYWIGANLVLAAALVIYLVWPVLPLHLAIVPDALLVLGFALRHAAARSFSGRPIRRWLFALAPLLMLAALLLANRQSAIFALTNTILTGQALLVAAEFWRDRRDRLNSRMGLVAVYVLMAASFAARAVQGVLAADQVQSYIPYDTMLEVHLLAALVHVIAGSLFVLSLASECSAEALREAARRDPLTGLLNRRAFDILMREHMGRGDLALAVADVDHFKAINDRHGHAAGDAVLRDVGAALSDAVGEYGHVARIGGEEFALVLVGVDAERAGRIACAARRAVANGTIERDGATVTATVSIGLAHADYAGATADAFLECADRALYRAKASGRNACQAGRDNGWPGREQAAIQHLSTGVAKLAS